MTGAVCIELLVYVVVPHFAQGHTSNLITLNHKATELKWTDLNCMLWCSIHLLIASINCVSWRTKNVKPKTARPDQELVSKINLFNGTGAKIWTHTRLSYEHVCFSWSVNLLQVASSASGQASLLLFIQVAKLKATNDSPLLQWPCFTAT